MKIALSTDWHIGARNDNSIVNGYFLNFHTNKFIPYLLEHNITNIITLGDIFDRRKYVNFFTLSQWRKNVFDVLAEHNIQHHIIIGNHDTYWKTTNDVNSVTELVQHYNNIHIYKEPNVVDFDGLPILLMPWIHPNNQEECIKRLQDSREEICMGHFEISGFEMFPGHTVDVGFPEELFQNFDMVLSGHFHHKSTRENIHYLGAPYEMTWADWGDEKGFYVFDTSTRKLEFIENTSKIFYKLYYNDEKETFETIRGKDYSFLKDLYVKIVVEKKTNPYCFDTFIENINKESPADISIVESVIDDSALEDSVDEAQDTLTILTEYVEGMALDKHKNELVERLRSLYLESVDMDLE